MQTDILDIQAQTLNVLSQSATAHMPLQIQFENSVLPHLQGAHIIIPRITQSHRVAAAPPLRGAVDVAALWLRHDANKRFSQHQPRDASAAVMLWMFETARLALCAQSRFAGVVQNVSAWLSHVMTQHGAHDAQLVLSAATAGLLINTDDQRMMRLIKLHARGTAWLVLIQPQLERLQDLRHDQDAFLTLALQLIEQFLSPAHHEPSPSHADDIKGESTQPQPDHEQPSTDALQTLAASGAQSSASTSSAHPLTEQAADGGMPSSDERDGGSGGAGDVVCVVDTGYRVYTKQFDETVMASDLASSSELLQLSAQLREQSRPYLPLVQSLTARMIQKILGRMDQHWQTDTDDGVLNMQRLARLWAQPHHPLVYKRKMQQRWPNTCVMLLLDNSGSMRGRPMVLAALGVDILVRTLERCGVRVGVLGYTTKHWKGGDSFKLWQANGSPPQPGRLNDLRHIIYKSPDQPWSVSARNMGLVMKEGILKENIDGEALLWASQYLSTRTESRRILLVVSDGAPVDDATLSHNSSDLLAQHLLSVVQSVQRQNIELRAIGIGHDVRPIYPRAVMIRDATTLAPTFLEQLSDLFTPAAVAVTKRRVVGG